MLWVHIMFLTAFLCSLAMASAQLSNSKKYCSGFEPQRNTDLDQVLGLWYAVEVVHHWEGSNNQQLRGRSVVDTCPIIHLDRAEESRLRLLWTENAGIIEYTFSVDHIRHPSLWISIGAQNGTLLNRKYRQFAGTVEVTKAVGDHMVLTFCTPGREIYSVVLSRDRWLSQAELEGVNNMLAHRGLQSLAIREACKNSSNIILPGVLLILLVMVQLGKIISF
ncbi:uncharacterized protein [Halyomorpha halys]|uniref:uncharacterized protein isoform X2 n=1 Tax=Halyomorpha halys TaxID=286706 RepID=UPI0006D4D849